MWQLESEVRLNESIIRLQIALHSYIAILRRWNKYWHARWLNWKPNDLGKKKWRPGEKRKWPAKKDGDLSRIGEGQSEKTKTGLEETAVAMDVFECLEWNYKQQN
jgi:hypothetical protein